MARLFQYGAEISDSSGNFGSTVFPDGDTNQYTGGAAAFSRDTSVHRTGAASWKANSGVGNSISDGGILFTWLASTTYYLRAYEQFSNLPSASFARVLRFGTDGNGISARLTSGGKLQLWNEVANTQIGSDSAVTLSADSTTWYRIELKATFNASTQISDAELRLDGSTVASTSGLTLASTGATANHGWISAPGASCVMHVDDVALNNSAGANNNSWCGDGKVVLLLPISDNARGTGWVGGAGGTTNLFNAVDNTPPVGVADTGTDTSQIRNATSAANSNMDFNLTSYTTAGICASDTINAVIPWVCTAAPVTTSAKQGTVGVVSNPAITNIALGAGGTTGAFWAGAAAANYITQGWKWSPGTLTEAPSVTLGTSPVMRITQVTASTRIADVCFMGMYVDYTPAVSTFIEAPSLIAEQAVMRGSVY